MKLLSFTHQLDIGGAEINAIDLAASLREHHGVDVVLFATPGPLTRVAEKRGLRILPGPRTRIRPSRAMINALRQAVRKEKPDLIHAWDWWQALDAFFGVYLPWRVPLIVTDMTMNVTRLLPKHLPTTFGTQQLVERARANGWTDVELLHPMVDTAVNNPDTIDNSILRAKGNIQPEEHLLLTVSRLDNCLKRESLFRTIDAVESLSAVLPLRFLIIGDGNSRDDLDRRASETNRRIGREVVTLLGEWIDPRAAYAGADLVIGMGSSAMRALAFGKSLVVVGASGYARRFDRATASEFLYQGFYGHGDGDPGNRKLISCIRESLLSSDPSLSHFSRDFVQRHYALSSVSDGFIAFCERVLARSHNGAAVWMDAVRSSAIYLRERRFLSAYR